MSQYPGRKYLFDSPQDFFEFVKSNVGDNNKAQAMHEYGKNIHEIESDKILRLLIKINHPLAKIRLVKLLKTYIK